VKLWEVREQINTLFNPLEFLQPPSIINTNPALKL
jgi:hypothetical protein